MSSNDIEIGEYKQKIKKQEAEIERIKSHKDYDMLDARFSSMIKSKEDAIDRCEIAMHDLRQQQMPGK